MLLTVGNFKIHICSAIFILLMNCGNLINMNSLCARVVKKISSSSINANYFLSSKTSYRSKPWAYYLSTGDPYSKEVIENMVKKKGVVIFMKGIPEAPRCGFSNAVIQIVKTYGIEFETHDVLQSEGLREGVKMYADWPTIPQVFVNGEFIGGCDIVLELHKSGELAKTLEKAGITATTTATPKISWNPKKKN